MRRFFTIENLFFVLFFFGSMALLTINTNKEERMFTMMRMGVSNVQVFAGTIFNSINDTFYNFAELFVIREKYRKLETSMVYYYGLERENITLQEENKELREALSLKDRIEYKYTMARVLAKDSSNMANSIVVDKGLKNGIKKDMNVLGYSKTERMFGLVGKVVDVYEDSSRIMPIYDSSQYVAAKVDKKYHQGLVQGTGNLSSFATLNYVPVLAMAVLKKGDVVLSSGLTALPESSEEYESIYSEGFFIGRIADVGMKYSEGSSLNLPLESIVNFNALEKVYILEEKPKKIESTTKTGAMSLLTVEGHNSAVPIIPSGVKPATPVVAKPIIPPATPVVANPTPPNATPDNNTGGQR